MITTLPEDIRDVAMLMAAARGAIEKHVGLDSVWWRNLEMRDLHHCFWRVAYPFCEWSETENFENKNCGKIVSSKLYSGSTLTVAIIQISIPAVRHELVAALFENTKQIKQGV